MIFHRRKKILLLDGSNIAYLSRFGNFKTDDDLPESEQGWKEVIVDRIADFMSRFGAHSFIWVMDSPPYERALYWPAYKQQRDPDTPKGHRQWMQIREDCQRYFPCAIEPGYEADDLIARLCQKYGDHPDWDIIICSSDKDLAQLIPLWNNVSIWRSSKGEWVPKPKYDVVTYLALLGDSSDNIPGCTGEVTAKKLINGTPEDFEEFLNKPYRVKKTDRIAMENGWIEKLPETNREVYLRNRRLVSLLGPESLIPHCPLNRFCDEPTDLSSVFSRFLNRPWPDTVSEFQTNQTDHSTPSFNFPVANPEGYTYTGTED